MKFLIIDDSPEIIEAVSLCIHLRWPQSEVLSAGEGEQGLELVKEQELDLVVLDVNLPDMGGFDVLRSRREFSDVPVVMLTVRNQDVEIARFLEEGADDYVTKPFSHVELMGRIQAIFRRAQSRMRSSAQTLQAGDLVMDFGAAEVFKAGQTINLTRTEMALLSHFVRNATRVATYESLSSNVLKVDELTDSEVQLLKVHIQHLRSKLGDSPASPKYIANVYGVGYKFGPQVTAAVAAGQASGG